MTSVLGFDHHGFGGVAQAEAGKHRGVLVGLFFGDEIRGVAVSVSGMWMICSGHLLSKICHAFTPAAAISGSLEKTGWRVRSSAMFWPGTSSFMKRRPSMFSCRKLSTPSDPPMWCVMGACGPSFHPAARPRPPISWPRPSSTPPANSCGPRGVVMAHFGISAVVATADDRGLGVHLQVSVRRLGVGALATAPDSSTISCSPSAS